MSKVLVVFSEDNFVRNYLRTDALVSLSRAQEVSIVADRLLALAPEIGNDPRFKGFFTVDLRVAKRHHMFFNVFMWRNRRKSRTFFYRWMRNSGWDLVEKMRGCAKLWSAIRWIPGALLNPSGLRVPFWGNPLLFPLAKFLLLRRLPINPELSALVAADNYDLIVFPSAAFDPVSVDLTRLGKKLAIPTLCLIDNWDNLTSKTSFWTKPDHLGVWGEQAKEQARRIHDFPPDRVHPIGTPRFDQYFSSRGVAHPSPLYPFPYILFVGSAMPFDEIGTLHFLERILSELESAPPELKVVYRPHPWQQKRKTKSEFRAADFSRTVLDMQIAEAYDSGVKREVTDPSFQPELDYYPRLFQGAILVMGPLTTMLLEGALALKPIIGIAYDDGHHANTSRRYFTHFDGVEAIPSFLICDDPSELSAELRRSLLAGAVDAKASDAATLHFLHHDATSYPTRLGELIGKILSPS